MKPHNALLLHVDPVRGSNGYGLALQPRRAGGQGRLAKGLVGPGQELVNLLLDGPRPGQPAHQFHHQDLALLLQEFKPPGGEFETPLNRQGAGFGHRHVQSGHGYPIPLSVSSPDTSPASSAAVVSTRSW